MFPSLASTGAVLALILGFGFLIFIHELGHFLAAKWVGIKVTQFAIGFGQSICAWRKGIGLRIGSTEAEYNKRIADLDDEQARQQYGETEYRLNWLPLGGYVKMLGQEDMDPAAQSDDPRSFNKKSVPARALVISAGVVMNLVFGVIFFIVAFMAGVAFPPAVVGDVAPGSPAATTYATGHADDPEFMGLRTGDRVRTVNGGVAEDFMTIAVNTALAAPGEEIDLEIEREGVDGTLLYEMQPVASERSRGLLSLGIQSPTSLVVAETVSGKLPDELEDAGVQPGMRVIAVDGQAVDQYHHYADAIAAKRGEPVTVTFAKVNKKTGEASAQTQVSIEASPSLMYDQEAQANHLLGLVPAMRIASVQPGSPAEQAELQAGDIVARVGETPYPTVTQFQGAVKNAGSAGVTLEVLRDGERVTTDPIQPRNGLLGVRIGIDPSRPMIASVLPDAAEALRDLPAGSRLTAINGESVTGYGQAQRLLLDHMSQQPAPGSVAMTFTLNLADNPTQTVQLPLTAERVEAVLATSWGDPLRMSFDMLRVPVKANTPWKATVLGVEKTHQFMLQTYVTLLRLIQGTVQVNHLRGPVGIVDEGRKIAEQGWPYLLFFLGLISVNLVVLNFLPIPVVDGGLMVFLIIEAVKGSPANAKIQTAATLVGLALIGCLFILVTFNDIYRIVMGPMG